MVKMPKLKLAIVVSHPIQHFCPQYASFAANTDVDLKVFFASSLGLKSYYDVNFKREISWSNLYLDRFSHVFLNGNRNIPSDKKLDAPTLDQELDFFRPDLIIIYGYFQKLQRRAKAWANKNKIKIAYISDSELRHKQNRLKGFIKSLFVRRFFRGIDYFLSVGNANEEFYWRHGVKASQTVRMHFPIDIFSYKDSYLKKNELRRSIREEHSIGSEELVLAVVGKLVSWKNQGHIIDALEALEKDGVYAHLFILGSGEMKDVYEERSKRLVKSKVYMKGFVNSVELPAYYAAADVYIHPASYEPHSLAISEAIYMGCPVIISDRCGSYGATDDVQEGTNGCVYKFGDVSELAEKIKILMDTERRTKYGNASHEMATLFQERAHHGVLKELKNLLRQCLR